MRCDAFILKTLALSCLASACSGEGNNASTTRSDLSTRIWEKMLEAENTADYREVLSPELRTKHQAGLRLIQTKIPSGYPEPYFPYGALTNKDLDPGLTREPTLSEETALLGKTLFFDKSISFSKAHGFSGEKGLSCGSCHLEAQEFTDGEPLSKGIEGDFTHRNTPTLWNTAYYSTLTWSNPHFPIFEMQAKIPLFNDDPIEMGLRGKEIDLMQNLARSSVYPSLMKSAYQVELAQGVADNTANYTLVTSAIAAFERTLIRFDSTFDLFLQGKSRLSAEVSLGAELFYGLRSLRSGETLNCVSCHSGVLMTDSFQYVREGVYFNRVVFHQEIRTPSLRFVSKTAPYLHDGSLPSLDAVLDRYQSQGRIGPPETPLTHQLAFAATTEERAALKAFLYSL